MKKLALFVGIFLVLTIYVSALDLPKYKDQEYVPGILIVKFKEKPILLANSYTKKFEISLNNEILTSDTGKQAFNPRKQKGRHFIENIYIFKYDKNKDISKLINKIKKNPNVVWAEPDYIFEGLAIPNDPYYPQQWNFPKTAAPQGWNIEKGNETILIATIDTGIDWKHEDLAEKVWNNLGEDADNDGHTLEWNGTAWNLDPGDLNSIDNDGNGYVDDLIGWDFLGSLVSFDDVCASGEDCNTPDNDPLDRQGHGTFQYGLIGAKTNNSIGVAGLCWNCRLIGLRAGFKNTGGVVL